MMSIQLDRREFVAACAGLIALPSTLLALTAEDVNQDRDMEKILRELPQAKPHIDRMGAACERYASIFPVPVIWPAKMQAIESWFNSDAISNSYAVGSAQFVHATARELGAPLPAAEEFKNQDEVLSMRRRYQSKFDEAVTEFRKGNDQLAGSLRTEAEKLKASYEKSHQTTMESFKKKIFALSTEARRALDARFDPAVSDDLLVQYVAKLARMVRKDLDLIDEQHILLLAAVAYNAGPGNIKRKGGIPVVAQNVEYANKLMVFQKVKF